jgi:predicted transcriptional regulator
MQKRHRRLLYNQYFIIADTGKHIYCKSRSDRQNWGLNIRRSTLNQYLQNGEIEQIPNPSNDGAAIYQITPKGAKFPLEYKQTITSKVSADQETALAKMMDGYGFVHSSKSKGYSRDMYFWEDGGYLNSAVAKELIGLTEWIVWHDDSERYILTKKGRKKLKAYFDNK